MTSTITLDALVLNTKRSYSKEEFKDAFYLIRNNTTDRFRHLKRDSFQKAEQAVTVAETFSAVYLAISSKLEAKLDEKFLSNHGCNHQELSNLISGYVASQVIIQMNKNNPNHITNPQTVIKELPSFTELEFANPPKNVVNEILRSYGKYSADGHLGGEIITEAASFFYNFSRTISLNLLSDQYSKIRELLEQLVVQGPGFEIKRITSFASPEISKSSKAEREIEDLDSGAKKDFEHIVLTPALKVNREDYVGNQEPMNLLDKSLWRLMNYNPKTKHNDFKDHNLPLDFNQLYLFHGPPGTGKTMLIRYAMTQAEKINQMHGYGKELAFVSLNCESGVKDWGYLALLHQIKQIASGDKIYIVEVDEFDSKFSSRQQSNFGSGDQDLKLRLMLQFTDGIFSNHGNYLLLGTTNSPDKIDPAIRSRFESIYCPGPETAEEKARVLGIQFRSGLENGLVYIKDWRGLGEIAYQAELSGRDLKAVVRNCYQQIDKISGSEYQKINSANGQARKMIFDSLGRITDELVIDSIVRQQNKKIEEQKTIKQFYR